AASRATGIIPLAERIRSRVCIGCADAVHPGRPAPVRIPGRQVGVWAAPGARAVAVGWAVWLATRFRALRLRPTARTRHAGRAGSARSGRPRARGYHRPGSGPRPRPARPDAAPVEG